MVDWVRYGVQKRFPFKLTKDGAGVDLVIDGGTPATALQDGDVILSTVTDAGVTAIRVVDVNLEILKQEATQLPGCYWWQPPAGTDIECDNFTLNFRDADAADAFDENCIIGYTHGHPNARFNGT